MSKKRKEAEQTTPTVTRSELVDRLKNDFAERYQSQVDNCKERIGSFITSLSSGRGIAASLSWNGFEAARSEQFLTKTFFSHFVSDLLLTVASTANNDLTKTFFSQCVSDGKTGMDIVDSILQDKGGIYNYIQNETGSYCERILAGDYLPRSTCQMTNVVQQAEMLAKSDAYTLGRLLLNTVDEIKRLESKYLPYEPVTEEDERKSL
jgi:hypothetical protein